MRPSYAKIEKEDITFANNFLVDSHRRSLHVSTEPAIFCITSPIYPAQSNSERSRFSSSPWFTLRTRNRRGRTLLPKFRVRKVSFLPTTMYGRLCPHLFKFPNDSTQTTDMHCPPNSIHESWDQVCASALTDEAISDEGLAIELEKTREVVEWDCSPIEKDTSSPASPSNPSNT